MVNLKSNNLDTLKESWVKPKEKRCVCLQSWPKSIPKPGCTTCKGKGYYFIVDETCYMSPQLILNL